MTLRPLTLHEAALSLYLASPDGSTPYAEVFIGACAEGINLSSRLEEFRVAATGAEFQRTHHVDEEHFIEVRHVWVLSATAPEVFQPVRNQRYLAELVWRDRKLSGLWMRRRYFDVTFMDDRHSSGDASGAAAFEHGLRMRATRFQTSTQAATGGAAPVLPVTAAEGGVLAAFFREEELAADDYLLGHYAFTEAVTLSRIEARGLASQTDPTVLELEEEGVLSGVQITLPAGSLGEEVSASLTPARAIPATTELRWKVVSAPATGRSTFAAVVMYA